MPSEPEAGQNDRVKLDLLGIFGAIVLALSVMAIVILVHLALQ